MIGLITLRNYFPEIEMEKCTLVANTKLAFNRIFSPPQTVTFTQSNLIYHFLPCSKGSKNHIWTTGSVGPLSYSLLANLVQQKMFGGKDKGRIAL